MFFTACAFARRRVFVDVAFGQACVTQLLRAATAHDVAVLAFCLMPDHAHLLLGGRSASASLFDCTVQWKKSTALMARHRLDLRLWQDGVFDRALRDEEATLQAAVYVLANPIRAGLAARLGDYPLAGSTEFTMSTLAEAMQDGTRWRPGPGPTR